MKIFDKKRNKMEGLYDPRNEHDSCGLGFIANIKGRKSNDIIQKGIFILENLEHRGCLLYTSPSPRDRTRSRMPSSA